MPVTALYAGLLAVLLIALSTRVIRIRRGQGIALGDAGDRDLQRRIRAHANFAEYAPMGLILLGLAESLGAWALLLHLVGLVLLAGRAMHALGISREPDDFTYRVGGMVATFTALGLGAFACVVLSVTRLVG